MNIIQFSEQGEGCFGNTKGTLYAYFMEVFVMFHRMQPNAKIVGQ